ncbi:MAG TPA: BrnA antitoxin family protein [Bryobacteraceae bacterium]|nr:BrnA antitoxin family protein [Bryobacteraceae bacterium]
MTRAEKFEFVRSLPNEDDKIDYSDAPARLPPEVWAKGVVGKYYRPLKKQVTCRIDADVLVWLKAKGAGYLTQVNTILRAQMERERKPRKGKSRTAAG